MDDRLDNDSKAATAVKILHTLLSSGSDVLAGVSEGEAPFAPSGNVRHFRRSYVASVTETKNSLQL